jgi:hypothetical protein
VAALSWDAFPPPPPEAENWVPDPDSVARPGTLKDPRLCKDPYAEQKKAVLKREMRFQGLNSMAASRSGSISSSSGSTAPAVRAPLGTWPAQVPRTSGSYLEIIVPPRTKPATIAKPAASSSVIPAWAGPLEKVYFPLCLS